MHYRGNSKYHYYGIRIKADSPLNQLVPDDTPVAMRQATHPHRRIAKSNTAESAGASTNSMKSEGNGGGTVDTEQHKQFLGAPDEPIPQNDLTVESKNLPHGVTMDDVNNFDAMYKEHCEVSVEQ